MTGLDKNGKEPALKPFKLVVTGDMCFLQKMTATGGACKVKHFSVHATNVMEVTRAMTTCLVL